MYLVEDTTTGQLELMSASNGPTALRAVIGSRFRTTVPSGIAVADLIGKGVRVRHYAQMQPDLIDATTDPTTPQQE